MGERGGSSLLVLRFVESRVIRVDVAVDSRRCNGGGRREDNRTTCSLSGINNNSSASSFGRKEKTEPVGKEDWCLSGYLFLFFFISRGNRETLLLVADKGFCFLGRFAEVGRAGDGC